MKKSNFVSFSNLIKKREREIESQPTAEQTQVDFEALYLESQKETESAQAELQKVKHEGVMAKESWDAERESLMQIMQSCEDSVSVLKKELHLHLHTVWKAFFEQLIQDPDFHRLALHDMLGQAMIELGDQKQLHVEVPESLLNMANEILSGRDGWNIVGMEGETLAARFSTEHVHWETELEPVFNEFFNVLGQFLEARE
jgi:hypothetical protein